MRRFRFTQICVLLAVTLTSWKSQAQLGDKPGEEQPLRHPWKVPPSPALTPEEALETFAIEPGYRLELVAAEPLVQDPVAMAFDEQGSLWVVEMRGFMPALEAEDEDENAPVGRVVVLRDLDADGHFEDHHVFLDGLVSPRTLAHSRNGILVNDGNALFHVTDSNGDGQGDHRTLIDPDYIQDGNVEHQPNGMLQNLDGWFYNAKSTKRYRFHQRKWQIGETEFRGQWGITQDDQGRLFYNYNWDQLRGDVVPPNALQRNPNHSSVTGLNLPVATDQSVYPIRLNTGVNRGYREGILDRSGKLRAFASACGPHIYRGHLMPAFSGNAFVCGPGANIVKRNVLVYDDLGIRSHHAHEDREFLASTDERFRPVFITGGPDGALYIVDMYRGIIQDRAYMTTYLRREIEQRQLASPIHLGRIYRVVPEDHPAHRRQPEVPSGSVSDLAHPNGWHRDTAQRLLIERNERDVLPALRSLALHHENPRARIHALWTIASLGDDHAELLLPVLHSSDPGVVSTAVRILENIARDQPDLRSALATHLAAHLETAPLPARMQIALTLGELDTVELIPALRQLSEWHGDHPLMRDAMMSSVAGKELQLLEAIWPAATDRPGHLALLEALGSALVRERSVSNLLALMHRLGDDPASYGARHEAVISGMVIHANQRRFQAIHLPQAPPILAKLSEISHDGSRRLLAGWRQLFAWPGHEPPRPAALKKQPLSEDEARRFTAGRRHYATLCAGCHGSTGNGITPVAPPLLDSEWVEGDPQPLIRILLHGLEGPVHVNGKRYAPPAIQPNMPPLMALSDMEIASILTYIRRAWGHQASPVSSGDVTQVRAATSDRLRPWIERELRALMLEL